MVIPFGKMFKTREEAECWLLNEGWHKYDWRPHPSGDLWSFKWDGRDALMRKQPSQWVVVRLKKIVPV
jgi:hypothetical protein